MLRTVRALGLCLLVLIASAPFATAADPGARDPRIEKILSQISEQRLAEILRKLGSFGTRNTLSSTDSRPRGSARRASGSSTR